MSRRVTTFAIAALLLAICSYGLGQKSQSFYPTVQIDVPAGVNLSFLLHPQASLSSCEAMLGKISKATLATCPACRVAQLKCETELTAEQQKLAAGTPVEYPTSSFSDGVIVYLSPRTELAIATCQAGQNANPLIICHAANTARPKHEVLTTTTDFSVIAWRLVAAISGFVAVVLLGCAAFNRPLPAPGQIFFSSLRSLEGRSRRTKQIIILLVDVISLMAALWLAFTLRFERWYVPETETAWLFVVAPLVAVPAFIVFGLYHAIVRFLGMQAIWAIIKAVLLYTVLLSAVVFFTGSGDIPRSIIPLNSIFALALVALPRLIARDWFSKLSLRAGPGKSKSNVVIYGAGSAGIQLSTALAQSREMCPVAFVDDDARLHGQRISGLRVYAAADVSSLIQRLQVSEILLALPSTTRTRRNDIIRSLENLPVKVQTLPGLTDLAQGKIKVADLREVEIEDLLGRDPVAPRPELLNKNIQGKVVMVTGAGGSIGSELCRQICRLEATALILYDNSEYNLYAIEQELIENNCRLRLVALLGSVTDQPAMEQVIRAHGVKTVFHAAAYKHVPIVEANPAQGVINNIFGTWRAAAAALATGVETFVLISTDKAVRPTNIMGATKRFSEMLLQAMHQQNPGKTSFTMVRFGNVLGSSGSVVPLFRNQIKKGGPITVTDPRIVRYFMTVSEAAELVIQAGAMSSGGDVFVLDMGEPVKILDLATRMATLAGLSIKDSINTSGDIEIVFSGLRPGEKLYEELLIGGNVIATAHPRILRADENTLGWKHIESLLARLDSACDKENSETIQAILQESVEGYGPQQGKV